MNKKGSIIFYSLMLGLTIIVLALALAPPIQDFTDDALSDLDCDSVSISQFDKAACVVVDLNLFYFAGSLLLIGGVIVTAKIIF